MEIIRCFTTVIVLRVNYLTDCIRRIVSSIVLRTVLEEKHVLLLITAKKKKKKSISLVFNKIVSYA